MDATTSSQGSIASHSSDEELSSTQTDVPKVGEDMRARFELLRTYNHNLEQTLGNLNDQISFIKPLLDDQIAVEEAIKNNLEKVNTEIKRLQELLQSAILAKRALERYVELLKDVDEPVLKKRRSSHQQYIERLNADIALLEERINELTSSKNKLEGHIVLKPLEIEFINTCYQERLASHQQLQKSVNAIKESKDKMLDKYEERRLRNRPN